MKGVLRQCPHCTYPLRERWLDTDHKLTYCDNRNCSLIKEEGKQYQVIRKQRHKWEKK